MKKGLLTIFACAVAVSLGATSVHASMSDMMSDITWGAKAGLNLNKMGGNAVKSADNKNGIGFVVGGTSEMSINDAVSIEAAALYATKGSKDSADKTTSFGYLQVPVIVRYSIPQNMGGMTANVFAGGYGGYRLSAKKDGKAVTNADSAYSSIDYGITLGAGIKADSPMVSGGKVKLDVSYELGLRQLKKDTKANSIQIALGHTF